MNERKQSFLERLTGTQVINEDDAIDSVVSAPARSRAQYNHSNMESSYDEYEESGAETEDEEEIEAGLAIDMYETDNELVIQSMIAGVTTENLQIAITRDMVTIKGKRIPPNNIPERAYIERELYWGVFSREIELPFEIDTDGAEAVEKFGLLIIRLPKLDVNRMQELKVKSI